MVDINIKLEIPGSEQLLKMLASGIGAVGGPMLARVTARAEADALRIKAQGEADALRIEAHGKGDALRLIVAAQAEAQQSFSRPPSSIHGEIEVRGEIEARLSFQEEKRQASVQAFWLTQLNSELPEPNWVVQNPATGNLQPSWCLASPVHRGETARAAPLHLFARACEFFRWICEADTGFVGCLQRNPVQEPHKTFWGRTAPFELAELVGCLPAGWKMPRVPKTAVGRNDGLFRALCSFVGRPSNYHVSPSELAAVADMKNQAFALHGLPPLDGAEVAGIVRSVYKRHQRKLSSGEQQRRFSFIQANRAKKGGQKRREKRAERDAAIQVAYAQGETQVAIAERVGITRRAVGYILCK